jgi:glycosyltransferase involved in cell wall biosynthesis
MQNANITLKEDQTGDLLDAILFVTGINWSSASVLKDMHRHLLPNRNLLEGLTAILSAWGIEAKSIPLSFEMLTDIPLPSVVFLLTNSFDPGSGEFFIVLNCDEENVRLLNTKRVESTLPLIECQERWTQVVIVLDADDAADEPDYHPKVLAEQDAIHHAGGVSVIMPVFNQALFIARALSSLQLQTYQNWELIIINDGSQDDFQEEIQRFLSDKRIRVISNERNEGLGNALNKGCDAANYNIIAYLPADDIFYEDHLYQLVQALATTGRTFAYSGVLHHFSDQVDGTYGQKVPGQISGYPLQLVQVAHCKTAHRWMEREELVTDDLNRMFWNKFLDRHEDVITTRQVTCEWVDHASQRHKVINDRNGGGIYLYKRTYGVSKHIRFQSTVGNFVDEITHFAAFRTTAVKAATEGAGLKILLVGELAFNPERICALEERGHKLYGLWIENPVNFNTIGPLPFGNVEDIPLSNWKQRVEEIQPDIIYALLNYHAVFLAYHIMMHNPGIPFVWHFKEGPFYCRHFGTWNQLIKLYAQSDGQIYTNSMVFDWFQQFLDGDSDTAFILDGDLPKTEWFTEDRSPRLSDSDGQIHTVVAGRPMGLTAVDIKQMANQQIHLHLYGDIFQNQFKEMISDARKVAGPYLHLHPNCSQGEWVKEFSQYDAGWLHFFKSENGGSLLKASWHDLNYPARMSTYAMAGLPMLMRDNQGHRVACQEFLEKENMALLFPNFENLRAVFENTSEVEALRTNVWNKRKQFSFDYHVDDLVAFFNKIISKKHKKSVRL